MKKLNVAAIKLQTINDKDLLYIKIYDEVGKAEHINVGQKTWDKILKLIEGNKLTKEEKEKGGK